MARAYEPEHFVDRERELRGFDKLLQPGTPQAVMLIEAGELMGKSWLLDRMDDLCTSRAVPAPISCPIPVAKIDFRGQQHDIQDALSLVRLVRDALGQPGYFYELNAAINWFTEGRLFALLDVFNRLTEEWKYSLEYSDLKKLCVPLHIVYDDLKGGENAPISEKISGLLEKAEGQQKLPELFDALRMLIPDRSDLWSAGEQVVRAALDAAPQPAAAPGTPVDDLGASLPVDGRSQAEAKINATLFAGLHALEQDGKPAVLLFDSVEEAPEWAALWIRDQLLGQFRAGTLVESAVIVAGRDTRPLQGLPAQNLVVLTGLTGFGTDAIRKFLETYHVAFDDARLEFYADTSGGKPGLLALMADNELARQQKDDPFFQ
jgi:hypothetical protein